MKRLAYGESCRMLQQLGWLAPGNIPTPLQRPPHYDDTVLGVQFFRAMLTMAKLEHLTLPQTFFDRSETRSSFSKNARFQRV
jgi:hypothetical protein